MSDIKKQIKEEVRNFIPELQQKFRDERESEIFIARKEERENNIAVAAEAMLDAGLDDETVVQMLQKYWDLRRSETESFLKHAHRQLNLKNKD